MAGSLPPVCILAGGLGTRLGEQVRNTPKPLIEIAGEPFLHHQLRLLRSYGARRIVLCVGYLGEQIEQRIGSDRFGLEITYSYDGPSPIGTLGAIRTARGLLGERFLVLYGDTYLRLDYRLATQAWIESRLPAMMTVLRNEGRWDTSNADLRGSRVVAYDKRSPRPDMQWIDYGLGGLTATALDVVGQDVADLSQLYHELARRGELFGFAATERFYEIGTRAALEETAGFLSSERGRGTSPGGQESGYRSSRIVTRPVAAFIPGLLRTPESVSVTRSFARSALTIAFWTRAGTFSVSVMRRVVLSLTSAMRAASRTRLLALAPRFVLRTTTMRPARTSVAGLLARADTASRPRRSRRWLALAVSVRRKAGFGVTRGGPAVVPGLPLGGGLPTALTVQRSAGGAGSTVPAASVARTENECWPSDSPL
jgi:hypothetical protein